MSTLGPHDPDQEYVDRLRAADPAASSEPDMAALRAALAGRTVAADAGSVVPDQLAARRSRRWLPIAAAAAAALVVGTGGGIAIGASGGFGGAGDSGAPMAVNEAAASEAGPGAADSAAGGASKPDSAPMPAPDGRLAERGGADMSSRYYGRTVFTAGGLSQKATTAHAWALDAASVDAAALERLAAAVGLDGSVQQTGGALVIGPTDGSGPNLSLYSSASGDVGYYNPEADPWRCTATSKAEEGRGDTPIAPEGGCSQRDLGPAPTVEQAEAELTTLLAAAGVDAGVDFGDTSSQDGWTSVTAYLLVDGMRSGLVWSASWTGGGLQSLYGTLAPLVDLGSYPVISPAEAVRRLGDPRFGAERRADGLRAGRARATPPGCLRRRRWRRPRAQFRCRGRPSRGARSAGRSSRSRSTAPSWGCPPTRTPPGPSWSPRRTA